MCLLSFLQLAAAESQYSLVFLQRNAVLLHEYGPSVACNFIKSIKIRIDFLIFFFIFSSWFQQLECCY